MKNIFLSDQGVREWLFPFGQVRPVSNLRIGILTLAEKWADYLGSPLSSPASETGVPDGEFIASNILPTAALAESIRSNETPDWTSTHVIQNPWHICQFNAGEIRNDFNRITSNRESAGTGKAILNGPPGSLFVEEGATIYPCWINTEEGPVYIGRNALIMEGVMIRGPVAICEGAVVKMGTRIYGGTTIGRYCTAGGEIKNSVMHDYSNKAHDGYLGDSVLGEWCNLGAGTSNSNLKNTASDVKVWNPHRGSYMLAGLKAGLFMGDYSRAAINTSFNTGTVVGVCCNIFGHGLTPKYFPNFSWGYDTKQKYDFEKAVEAILNWKKLKNKTIEEDEIKALKHIFEQS